MGELSMSGENIEKMIEQLDALSGGDADGDAESALNSALEELRKIQEKVAAVGKAAVGKAILQFMKSHPEVHSLRWTQYTPYFNDGDSCEFGVHEPEVCLTPPDGETGDEDDEDDDREYHDSWSLGYYAEKAGQPKPKALMDDMQTLYGIFCSAEDAMKATFGDHAEIFVDRDGECRVEEYSHD